MADWKCSWSMFDFRHLFEGDTWVLINIGYHNFWFLCENRNNQINNLTTLMDWQMSSNLLPNSIVQTIQMMGFHLFDYHRFLLSPFVWMMECRLTILAFQFRDCHQSIRRIKLLINNSWIHQPHHSTYHA